METDTDTEYMTTRELGALMRLSQRAILNRHYDGRPLPPVYKISHRLLFRRDEVEVWMRSQREAGPEPDGPP